MRVLCALVFSVLAVAGCAAPGAGSPDDLAEVSSSITSSSGASAAASSSSEVENPVPQAGSGEWPPKLIPGDLLEAGATTLQTENVTLTIPGGFVESQPGAYISDWPGTTGPATIVIDTMPTDLDASNVLSAAQEWARTAPVDIPNTISAAMGEGIVDGVQTWGLAVIDSSENATVITFSAHPSDFEAYLLYQSLCSIKVTL